MAGGGRKKLRNRPTYGTTLLGGQKDPSASSSCTVSTPDFSQYQRKSPQMTQKSMPPLHQKWRFHGDAAKAVYISE
ncbi:LOW QUALITY PROTEIN: hypothetical protein HID58_037822 [Brassica napus]|uniref:Uncharacterized protein n=1 Tax=Brassica napus TaxID=3708 RepID=A0ABQ8BP20_BRANA|nr:LOW QUALITY PROTEIN: hypothetical protein HID58_037822 [Brassica napus]